MIDSRQIIVTATDGLMRHATNGVLWWLFLVGASFGKSKTSYGAYQAFREADEALSDFNYDHFKQLVNKLQRDGLIKRKLKYSRMEIQITEQGKKQITSVLPVYRTIRQWDGFLYIISYDIPEYKRSCRDVLRKYLVKIGCARLQDSLWITPYSPRKLLDEFMESRRIQGTVLLSKLGKNGAIGTDKLSDLLDRVYHLTELNDRYYRFLSHVDSAAKTKLKSAVEFHSIVKDDPQLPFSLLPKNWKGNEAFKAYTNMYV